LKPFSSSSHEHTIKSEREHGDPFYFRHHELPGYDVNIGYLFNRPYLGLINPDLLQAFFNNENGNYVKYGPVLEGFLRVFGRSIGLTDGN
jgi:hypothetical protein